MEGYDTPEKVRQATRPGGRERGKGFSENVVISMRPYRFTKLFAPRMEPEQIFDCNPQLTASVPALIDKSFPLRFKSPDATFGL